MDGVKTKNKGYYVALWLMLLFVFNDLIFDFLFNFNGSDLISFLFTLAASVIVFVWYGKLKRTKITGEFGEISTFIKSNFDNWQVIFSILDIVCGIISLLSGIAFFACIFKALKFVYIPVKIVVVTNKNKTLIKAVSKSSLIWTIGRTATKNNNKKDSKMKTILKNIKNNPRTLIFGAICAVVFGYGGYAACEQFIGTEASFWPKAIIMIGFGILAFIGCILVGWDTIRSAKLYSASKKLLPEKCEQLINVAETLIEEQKGEVEKAEQDKIAKKVAKAEDKEALAIAKKAAKEQAIADKKAKKEAEKLAKEQEEAERKTRLLARAEEIKAEMAAKAQETNKEDRPQA